jgi:Short C-terminal domain
MKACPYCATNVRDDTVLCTRCLRLVHRMEADREWCRLLHTGNAADAAQFVQAEIGCTAAQAADTVERMLRSIRNAEATRERKEGTAPVHAPGTFARGSNGELELVSDRLVIRRHGVVSFVTHGLQGEKEIYLHRITSIQFKQAGTLTKGYVQFAFEGGHDAKRGIFQAAGDENTVFFTTTQQPDFIALKNVIDQRLAALRASSPAAATAIMGGGGVEGLERLAELRARGLLTDEEFALAKRKLLGK